MEQPQLATTRFLLANLHCVTCVSTIKRVLQECGVSPQKVSPNVVDSWVKIEHDQSVSVRTMAQALKDAGFEISTVESTCDKDVSDWEHDQIVQTDGAFDRVSRWIGFSRAGAHHVEKASQERAHMENCEQCRRMSQGSPHDHTSPTVSVVATSDTEVPSTWKASISIGGMTCASCSNAITNKLKGEDWIADIKVNLVANSAIVELYDKDKAPDIVTTIEDIGYDAQLDELVEVSQEHHEDGNRERAVDIHIDGFHCGNCPDTAVNSLGTFEAVELINRPTLATPIMRIKYTPEVPSLTIRRILKAVNASNAAFKASIYHPPTPEQRSKEIHARQQKQLLYRGLFTLVLAIPTLIIGIVYMDLVPEIDSTRQYLMDAWVSGINKGQIILLALSTPVYIYGASIFHTRAIKEFRMLWRRGSKTPVLQRFYRFGSMNMLMSLGTTIAYVSSVIQLIVAGVTHPKSLDNSGIYFDSVVFLTFFLLIGRLIEAYSKSKTGNSVEMLSQLRPFTAILVGNDIEPGQTVEADLLEYGDVVRVPQGNSPACDGKVVEGQTKFDESSLTGESRLVGKTIGDDVFSGTVNKDAPISIRITGIAGQSMLDQIVNVVRESQTKRAPMEKIADSLTAYFVPVITLIAVLTFLIWTILGYSGAVARDEKLSRDWAVFALEFAIAVFVVACPCGLALAAPTAIFVGTGLSAEHGILTKGGGEAFEKASKVGCVVFDKTGTLTLGSEPKITDSEIFPDKADASDGDVQTLLAVARAVEESSSHSIAKAIVSFCSASTDRRVQVTDVQEVPGKGLKATYNPEYDILIGNESLMQDYGVTLSAKVTASLYDRKREAKSIALIAIKPTAATSNNESGRFAIAAALYISDPVRPEAESVIRALHRRNIDVRMLSGDNITTARAVALQIGIPEDHVIAEVLPTEKASKIKELQASLPSTHGRPKIAMVGDGINDAPALAVADVGIAIGSGADIAIASAAFVLLKSEIVSVVTLLELSRTVFRRIKWNFGWALVYNLIAVPVAAGCLYAVVSHGRHVRLDPVWASLAMALSSVSVVLSSLALRIPFRGIGFKGSME